ncbi:MAG: alpha-amylase family protein [Pirellulaceae bacterium]
MRPTKSGFKSLILMCGLISFTAAVARSAEVVSRNNRPEHAVFTQLAGIDSRPQEEPSRDSPKVAAGKHRADWMSKGSFGLMVHYLISPTGNTPEEKTADFNRTVNAFDVSRFLQQFNSTAADWLIFTIGQNTSYYNSPNRFLDARLPGHTPRRDLVLEIATGLKTAGKRFIAYMPAELAAPADLHPAFGWRADDPQQAVFQPNYQAFVRAFSLQYGKNCDGWWFDGCYEWPVFPNKYLDFAGYIAAARSGNPDAITAFNDGAFCVGKIKPVTPLEDYHAGEIHTLVDGQVALGWWQNDPKPYLPDSRFVEGVQWHGLLPVDSTFCGPALPDQHYDDATLIKLLQAVKSVGGALTFNLPIGRDGVIPDASLAQMQRLGRAGTPVTSTVP